MEVTLHSIKEVEDPLTLRKNDKLVRDPNGYLMPYFQHLQIVEELQQKLSEALSEKLNKERVEAMALARLLKPRHPRPIRSLR